MNLNLAEEMEPRDVMELEDVLKLRDNSPEKQRMDEIRQISNIIQALENLVVQCEGVEGFEELQALVRIALRKATAGFREKLHQ